MTLALVSPRRNRRSRAQTPRLKIDNQHSLARPGPSPARTRFWKSGNQNIQNVGMQTSIYKKRKSKSESVSLKMSARSEIAGKRTSRPHFMPLHSIFPMDRTRPTIDKVLSIFLGGPMGPIHPVWGHVLVPSCID